ncbi:MAG TPA: PEP/pyruvate-binding domain-containing protein [Parachlamydiaceae bacterium]|nr:PEP/pyruvate-binding domain-containing protein [Parachlamydiaceae bacterium]
MQPFNYSKNEIRKFVQQWYDAADEELDSFKKNDLYKDTESIAKLIENKDKSVSNAQIQNIANFILEEFDSHSVSESHTLSAWVAKNSSKTSGAYKPLHHLFKTVAKSMGKPDALKLDRSDPSGVLASLEHIDSSAFTLIKDYRLEKDELKVKNHEAATLSSPDRYQHLNVYGNKHKHNVMLKDLVETLKVPGVIVPSSYGIETDQMVNFLNIHAPEVFTLWKKLGNLYSESNEKETFLKSPQVIELLSLIDKKIQSAFKKADEKAAVIELGISHEMQKWISEVKKRGCFLVLRSSGAEDTRTSANAGGNESVSYVKPSPDDYVKELGNVVRSYFGEASLKNRLNAGHNPFDEPLSMAVTVQELIGEDVGGSPNSFDVPISLVLFTNEPLYVGTEKFRVMRISASYGHGEGVVGQEGIATDTIMILQNAHDPKNLHVIYDNQYKPERLAPVLDQATGKVKLGNVPNTKEMGERPVLTAEHIERLFQWGVIGERFFDNLPEDMEIVIKNNIIYPVQARPINRPELLPSYLDLKKIRALSRSPILEGLNTEMIVSGQASVVAITKPEEILIEETLKNAEQVYEKDHHKLVTVGQPEGANTHPVVNFSNMGTPCLYARGKNYQLVQDLAAKVDEGHHLAVCMQSGNISLWDTNICPIEECSSKGFVVHPAKVAISFPVKGDVARKSGVPPEIPQEIKDLLLDIRTAATSKVALDHLETLQNHGWLKDYRERIERLEIAKKETPLLKRKIKPIIAAARSVEARVNLAFSEVAGILSQQQESERMGLLFNIKLLETVLFQEHVEGAIGHYSVLNMQESFDAADAIIAYQKNLSHPANFADVLMDGSHSPVSEVFEDWATFLLKLEPLVEKTMQGEATGINMDDIRNFKDVLGTFRQAGVLPLFMTFFLQKIDSKDPVEAVRGVIALMPSKEKQLIEQVFEWRKEIQQLQNQIGLFGHPKTYPVMFEKLKKAVDNFLPSVNSWMQKNNWEAISPISSCIALQAMKDLVVLYDLAVKTMKSSREIKNDHDKTSNFKAMQYPFLNLLREWLGMIDWNEFNNMGNDRAPISLDRLIDFHNRVKQHLDKFSDQDPNQLHPSKGFNVASSVFTAGKNLYPPHSIEDTFTVVHQNLIACISASTTLLFPLEEISASKIPQNLKDALFHLRKDVKREIRNSYGMVGWKVGNPQLMGTKVVDYGISFDLNLPLQEHSGVITLNHDKRTDKLSMEVVLVGGNDGGRWELLRDWVSILNVCKIIPVLSQPRVSANFQLSFTWDLTDVKDLGVVCMQLGDMAGATYTAAAPIKLIESVKKSGYFTEAINYLSKTKETTDLHTKLFNEYLNIVDVSNLSTLTIQQEILSRSIFASSHPVSTALIKAFSLYLSGCSLNEALKNVESKYRDFVSRQIEYFLNGSNKMVLLSLLKESIVYGRGNKVKADLIDLWVNLIKSGKGINETVDLLKQISLHESLTSFLEIWIKIAEIGQMPLEVLYVVESALKNPQKSYDITSICSNFIKNGKMLPELFDTFKRAYGSSNTIVRAMLLRLMNQLFAKGFQNSEIIAMAATGIHHVESDSIWKTTFEGSSVQDYAVSLWKTILESGHGISEALDLLQQVMNNHHIQNSCLKIWEILITQKLAIPEAVSSVTIGLTSKKPDDQQFSIKILKKLYRQGYGIPETIKMLTEIFPNVNSINKNQILQLCGILIENKHLMPEVIDFLIDHGVMGDSNLRKTSLSLMGKLIDNGKAAQMKINAATVCMSDGNSLVRSEAIALWKKLINRDLGYIEAIDCAVDLIISLNSDVRQSALYLWDLILPKLDQETFISKICSSLQVGFQEELTTDTHVKIWKKLIDRDLGLHEGLATAQDCLQNESEYVRCSGLDLLTYIIEDKKKITATEMSGILNVAQRGIKDPNYRVRLFSLKLWTAFKPMLKTSAAVKKALDVTLADWSFWQYGVPNNISNYYEGYWQSLSELKKSMES